MNSPELIYDICSVLVAAGVLLVARVFYAKLAGYDVDTQLTERDNPAVGTALFGFLGGLLCMMGALLSTDLVTDIEDAKANDLTWDLAEFVIYSFIGIALLKTAGWINDRFILRGFENRKELVQDRNIGVGAVLAGSYLASGLVLAGALSGRVDPSLTGHIEGNFNLLSFEMGIAATFFIAGQIALVIYGLVYRAFQKGDVLKAIEEDYESEGQTYGGNAAAGIALAGNLVAYGLVLFGGARHDFVNWNDNLTDFGIAALVGLVLLPLWRLFVDKVMLSKADLAKEIFEDRNINAALLETICVIGLALVLVFAL